MATGARIVLMRAGWRIKPEFNINTSMHASQTRKSKHISGKITRARLKRETIKLIDSE